MRYPASGTESDYQSRLALKPPDYQDMFLADFNAALLAWADEDHERTVRMILLVLYVLIISWSFATMSASLIFSSSSVPVSFQR